MRFSIKNIKIDFKKFFLVLLSSLVTAILISFYIISLPKTELIDDRLSFDLTTANTYTTKRYVLSLDNNEGLNNAREILTTRLKKFGVSDLYINITEDQKLEVIVTTNKNIDLLDQFVTQRYFIEFVTRKEGVDFENEEDIFVIYNKENYNSTGYTREKFRNIHITQLKTTTGDLAYFAIYKPWEHELVNFDKYFNPLAGQTAGILIDDFVYPMTIPQSSITDQYGNVQRQPFAIGIGEDEETAYIQNILLNSGVIQSTYKVDINEVIKEQDTNINIYILLLVPLFVIVSIMILNKIFIKDNIGIVSFVILSTLPITLFIVYLKLSNIPVSIFELFIISIISILINYLLTIFSKYRMIYSIILFITFLVIYFTSYGMIQMITLTLLYIIVINYILHIILPYYFKLLKYTIK